MEIKTIPAGPLEANSYLLIEKGDAVLIDCGGVNSALEEALKGLSLRAILLTHGHWDHVLGVAEVKEMTGAEIAMHKDDAERLADGKLSGAANYFIKQTPLVPERLLQGGELLGYGEIELRVLHTPGHTPGCVCFIHEPTRSLFSGDTLFLGTCGRTDLPGGNWKDMLRSMRLLRELSGDYAVYPGHGPSTTLSVERRSNPEMLMA